VRGNASAGSFLVALDRFLTITYNADDLNLKCTAGYYEAIDQATRYSDFTTDPTYLLSNLVYNFGLMYNSVREVTAYVTGKPAKSKSSFDAGYQVGQLFYFILIKSSIY
jgi:hypothetical protein